MTPLERYLAEHELSQEEFAARIPCKQGTISRLLPQNGRPPLRRPSLKLAARIQAVTNGAVPMGSWLASAYAECDPEDAEPLMPEAAAS
jgi:transcriptional regulator with XRE-family HTH domain